MIKCTQTNKEGYKKQLFFLDINEISEAIEHVENQSWQAEGTWSFEEVY